MVARVSPSWVKTAAAIPSDWHNFIPQFFSEGNQIIFIIIFNTICFTSCFAIYNALPLARYDN